MTKGGTRALRDLDLFRPKRDAFATTLTSLDEKFSLKWERNAAVPNDRIEALRKFHNAGIFTWVSLEPTIDIESSLAIVQETHEFIDLYKVGRVNYLPMTKTTDWEGYTLRMVELLNKLGAKHYIKKDHICRKVIRIRCGCRSITDADQHQCNVLNLRAALAHSKPAALHLASHAFA